MPEPLPSPATGLTVGPPPTLLPTDGPDAGVAALVADGVSPQAAAAEHPASSLAWALLAEQAEARSSAGSSAGSSGGSDGAMVEAYAYARTGYHRGLDALRRAGWRGAGPVPFGHEPNRGFLRSLAALGRAAASIGEEDEAARISAFLVECDAGAVRAGLLAGPR